MPTKPSPAASSMNRKLPTGPGPVGVSAATPASLGYRTPAEWAPHEATWLAWPHHTETWPGKRLAAVEETYLQMLEALLPREKVHLLVRNEREQDRVLSLLQNRRIKTTDLLLYLVPTADAWIRDYGPTFVVDSKGKKAWVKWIFNAWGGKYPSHLEDTKIFSRSLSLISHPCFESGIVLEGGSIEVNGEGTCLTTEQCLLNPNRNSRLTRLEIEQSLKDYLGISHLVWLREGICGDDTDGHIDDIARFVDSRTILAACEEDERDDNCPILKENWGRLKEAKDEKGRPWNLVKLPMPGAIADGERRLPASYANFYIANSVVLLPVFHDRHDERAVKILTEHFPKREIISIPCLDLVYGLGALHCITQQEPACPLS